MTFDKILNNDTRWAVRYDGVADNVLQTNQAIDADGFVDFLSEL